MSLPYDDKKGCPAGYHKRKSYLSLLGLRVKPRCIKSTTVYKNNSKTFKNKESGRQTRKNSLYIPSIKSLARKACPPGMIERRGYVRKYSTAIRQKGFTVKRASGKSYRVYPKASPSSVNSVCVKDTGKPGKGVPKSIGPLRKGELAKHGYSFRDSEDKRHAALKLAVEDYGALGVYRKLDAVAKLTVRTVPRASEVYTKDRAWIQTKYGPLKAPA
jgi:hypothetical protein